MYIAVILTVLSVVTAIPQADYNRYVGYKVLEIVPTSQDQVATLHRLMLENTELDFWQEPSRTLGPVHVMAGPQQMVHLTTLLRKKGMAWTVYKDHIERDIDEFVAKERLRRSHSKKDFNIDDFNTLADIMGWLEEQAATCSDGLTCELYTAEPSSVEGRPIPIFTVSSGGGGNKPVFFLDATIHAREWLAPATILKIMEHVLSGNDNELVNNVDFVFMPVYNPDGYEYSWTNERLWRKNRQQNDGGCIGVDLNRNGNFRWGEEGVSHNACSDIFCGTEGNSEPETLALSSEVEKYADAINNGGAYVTFHAYGYMWMHPWGNTINYNGGACERADDHDDMYAVAEATAVAIGEVHGTNWDYGTSCEVIYATTGGSDDYSKGVLNIKYPFCPELRGNGFIIDPDQIQPSFEEVWAGLVAKYGALNP